MLSSRDNAIKEFLEDFEIANTGHIKQLFFKDVSLRACQERLKKLAQYKMLKRFREHTDQEYLYCVEVPRQKEHFYIRTQLYFECMKYYEIDQWTNRTQIGNVIPDAYIQLIDHEMCFGLFVEIHRSNNTFNQAKYESLYLSGLWREKFNSFPRVLIVTDKKVTLQPSKIKYRIVDTQFNGLNKIFF